MLLCGFNTATVCIGRPLSLTSPFASFAIQLPGRGIARVQYYCLFKMLKRLAGCVPFQVLAPQGKAQHGRVFAAGEQCFETTDPIAQDKSALPEGRRE